MQYKKSEYRPDKIPQGPGVYIFRNQLKEVIYVGKAKSLRKRMANYFQAARSKTANPKLRSLIQTIAFYEFRQVKTEAESLILESKLIKEFTPRFNTLMRDDKRYPMLKIDLSENFPRLQLARVKKDDGCKYLGPFPETGALKATLDYLSRYFNLRTCSPREPDEEDYAHCHDDLIRHCSAPCMKRISKQDYQAKIKELISVIGGTTSALQSKLKEEMTKEAANMNFEKAAILRDVIHNLDSVFQVKNRNFTNTSHQNYPGEAGVVSLQKHLKMDKPPEHIECFDISNIMGTFTVASMVCFKGGKPSKKDYRHYRIQTVEGIDDFKSMQEVTMRRYMEKEGRPQLPDLILIDGGKGQLHKACDVIEFLGLDIPVISLAKREELIFIPGKIEPLRLERTDPGLRLAQCLRDEAHRFAISYNRDLRRNRLLDSLLDDIEGVGNIRKLAILKAFGSVRNLRRHNADELIRRVPGIGEKLAQQIMQFIKKEN